MEFSEWLDNVLYILHHRYGWEPRNLTTASHIATVKYGGLRQMYGQGIGDDDAAKVLDLGATGPREK